MGLAIAVVGGLGADAVCRFLRGHARIDRRAALAVAALGAGLIAFLLVVNPMGQLRTAAYAFFPHPLRYAEARQVALDATLRAGALLATAAAVVVAGAAWRTWLRRRDRATAGRASRATLPSTAVGVGLVALVAVDLVGFASGWNVQSPRDDLFPTGPGIAALQEASAQHRTAGADGAGHANANLEYGIDDLRIRGFLTARQRALLDAAGARFLSTTRWKLDPQCAEEWDPWLTVAGVRTVIAPTDGPPAPPGWTERDAGPVRLLDNPHARPHVSAVGTAEAVPPGTALPRLAALASEHGTAVFRDVAVIEAQEPAALPDDSTAEVVGSQTQGARTTARVRSDGGAVLVALDAAVPGWCAEIDGAPAPVVTVDHLFTGVVVPPGEHVVELRYRAPGAITGRALSVAAVLALLCWGAPRPPRPSEPEPPRRLNLRPARCAPAGSTRSARRSAAPRHGPPRGGPGRTPR